MSVPEPFTTDIFRIWYYKRILCARKEKHEWAACTFAHPGERANRRDPRSHGPTLCHELEKTGECPLADQCPNAHSVFEAWLHPLKYRTQMCSDAVNCTRNLCFFAHNADELRQDTSIPPCPPEYDQIMAKAAATSTSSSRHSHGYHAGHRGSSAPLANSPAGPVTGYGNQSSSTGGGYSTPPQQYYSGQGLRGSEGSSSTSVQQQHSRTTGPVAGGTVSPSAVKPGHQQPVPGMYMTMPVPAVPMVPLPAGFNAAAAATYGAPYPMSASGMTAAVYMPSAGYMQPASFRGTSSTSGAAKGMQPQPPQRQGTGVYVPVAAGLQGVANSSTEGYTTNTPQQQLQATAAWVGSNRGRGAGGASGGDSSRSSAAARTRSPHHSHQQGQQHEPVQLTPQNSARLQSAEQEADLVDGIEPAEVEEAVYKDADKHLYGSPGDTPSRQNSAAADAEAMPSAPAHSNTSTHQLATSLENNNSSELQLHITPSLPTDDMFHQPTGDVHDVAAALAAAGGVQSTEAKLRQMREMLRAALNELSATRARAQAAEARIAAAESYMTKAALQAYAAADVAANRAGRAPAASDQPGTAHILQPGIGVGSSGEHDVSAAAEDAAAGDSLAPTQSKECAPAAKAVATLPEKGGEAAGQKDTSTPTADEAEAGTAATDEDDMHVLSELLPVSCAVLTDSRMLVVLPKAMSIGDVGSLVRAAMARAGANELQVRTADVIMQAQLVAMRESQAEMQLMQAELDSARKAAQYVAADRDKYEVKYRSYKVAVRQQAAEVHALQQQIEKVRQQEQEARTSAANAWALVKQGQNQGTVNWADAISESDGEGSETQALSETAEQSVKIN